MIPLDFSGKLAVVAGVGDDKGFAWHIAKALNAAGARLVFSTHPRLVNVVENILERDLDAESRVLPFGQGSLKVEKVLPCDVSFDAMDDVDEKTRNDRRYAKHGDYSIQGMMKGVAAHHPAFDAAKQRPVSLDQRINNCRVDRQQAPPLVSRYFWMW